MNDADPAAGAMPSPREKTLAPPSESRPRGRPKGSRNSATIAVEALLDGAAEALTRTLVDKALAGDGVALRFCVGRLLPARRDCPVAFDLPEIASAGDLVKAARALLAACAQGVVSPGEANEVMDLIIAVQALEKMAAVEQRVIALERRQQACAAKAAREWVAQSDRPPSRPARAGRRQHEPFAASGCESERGLRAPRPVCCKSPVFNSTPRFAGWARSPAGAKRFARAGRSPRAAFAASGREIERGIRVPRRGLCKSPVFNSFSMTSAGHRQLQETFPVRWPPRWCGGITAGSTRPIRAPPAHHASIDGNRVTSDALLEHDDFSSNRHRALSYCWSMIPKTGTHFSGSCCSVVTLHFAPSFRDASAARRPGTHNPGL
jgi:hypothetical protein